MLTGYKTYACSLLGVLVLAAMGLGYVSLDTGLFLLGMLGFSSLAALRSALKTEVAAVLASHGLTLPQNPVI